MVWTMANWSLERMVCNAMAQWWADELISDTLIVLWSIDAIKAMEMVLINGSDKRSNDLFDKSVDR